MKIFDSFVLPFTLFLALAAVTTFDYAFSKVSIWQNCEQGSSPTHISSGGCS
jgi:hypothetical protein